MAPQPRRRPAHVGVDTMIVQVEEVDEKGYAHCIDQFGGHMAIPTTIRRGKGALPAAGDQWIIDRASGRWTFASVLNSVPPEVTGSRGANSALASALEVLAALGFITDATTEGVGGGGGVTDHGALTGLVDDDHPQYLRQAEADALYDDLGAASDAVIAHEGDSDPHPQYLTEAEADDLYEPEGQAAAAVSAHVGASDPHTQYAKESDLGTASSANTTDFATATQGAKADTAVQPGSLGSAAYANTSAFDAAGAATTAAAGKMDKASNLSDVASVATAQSNLNVPLPQAYLSGYPFIPGGVFVTSFAPGATSQNRLNFEHWTFDEPKTVKVGFQVTVAGAAGTGGRVYVYAADSTGQATGSILFDTGLIAMDVTGHQESSSSYAFARGHYVLVWVTNSGASLSSVGVTTRWNCYTNVLQSGNNANVSLSQGAAASGSVVTPPVAAPTASIGTRNGTTPHWLRARVP